MWEFAQLTNLLESNDHSSKWRSKNDDVLQQIFKLACENLIVRWDGRFLIVMRANSRCENLLEGPKFARRTYESLLDQILTCLTCARICSSRFSHVVWAKRSDSHMSFAQILTCTCENLLGWHGRIRSLVLSFWNHFFDGYSGKFSCASLRICSKMWCADADQNSQKLALSFFDRYSQVSTCELENLHEDVMCRCWSKFSKFDSTVFQ